MESTALPYTIRRFICDMWNKKTGQYRYEGDMPDRDFIVMADALMVIDQQIENAKYTNEALVAESINKNSTKIEFLDTKMCEVEKLITELHEKIVTEIKNIVSYEMQSHKMETMVEEAMSRSIDVDEIANRVSEEINIENHVETGVRNVLNDMLSRAQNF